MVRRWGTVRGYGGPTVVMLSAVDGPPGPNVAAVHGPGDHQWLPHLVRGDRGGTIGSVTGHASVESRVLPSASV